jgi:thioredoxin
MTLQEQAGPASGSKDVTTASFRQDVIAESMKQPVLVDFWAPWCGPCKQLAPALEKAVAATKGRVRLTKMNIDDHPQIAGQLGIQSIPAVIAFDKGQPVDGFVGALPESQIKTFLERIAGKVSGGVKYLLPEMLRRQLKLMAPFLMKIPATRRPSAHSRNFILIKASSTPRKPISTLSRMIAKKTRRLLPRALHLTLRNRRHLLAI